jgi:hypothetical protein
MTSRHPVVFLVDVDNTLIDNDRIAADLKRHLEREVGRERQERYWAIFEELRAELGYADYLGALQRYRVEHPRDQHVLTVSSFLVNYPFANRLYPNSLDVLERFRAWGPTVILSDGDAVFQPRKIERAGLQEAVDGQTVKEAWGDRVTTIFPQQGHYAHDLKILATYPRADVSVQRIGDLLTYDLSTLLAAAPERTQSQARR